MLRHAAEFYFSFYIYLLTCYLCFNMPFPLFFVPFLQQLDMLHCTTTKLQHGSRLYKDRLPGIHPEITLGVQTVARSGTVDAM